MTKSEKITTKVPFQTLLYLFTIKDLPKLLLSFIFTARKFRKESIRDLTSLL